MFTLVPFSVLAWDGRALNLKARRPAAKTKVSDPRVRTVLDFISLSHFTSGQWWSPKSEWKISFVFLYPFPFWGDWFVNCLHPPLNQWSLDWFLDSFLQFFVYSTNIHWTPTTCQVPCWELSTHRNELSRMIPSLTEYTDGSGQQGWLPSVYPTLPPLCGSECDSRSWLQS